jgi:UDP-N-acetylglucosamine:LPS N-acetylglucosamine transferase
MYALIQELLADEERRNRMSRNLHSMARLDSTDRVCDIVEDMLKR